MYKNKKVLITGGLGFIGSNLARALLNEGAIITVVDSLIPQYGGNLYNIEDIKNRIILNISDVRDPFSMLQLVKGQDVLFNLAGQTSHLDSMNEPQVDLDINVSAQLSILESCRKSNPNIKIVFASTRQIYGKPDYLPVDESHPIRPVDINGVNKNAAESYHILYSNVYGIKSCVLRLTNTYGPGMRVKDARQTFLGIWIKSLVNSVPIQVYGDGLQLRDFNYVDDCVNALMLCGVSDIANGKIYNLGSTEVIELKKLAQMMSEMVVGSTFNIVPFPPGLKAIDIGDYYGNFNLISKEIGWYPKVGLMQGLQNTISFYQKNYLNYWEAGI